MQKTLDCSKDLCDNRTMTPNIQPWKNIQDGGRLGQTMGVQRNGGSRASMGWTRWIQKETLKSENCKFGSRRHWSAVAGAGEVLLMRVEKIMVLNWG